MLAYVIQFYLEIRMRQFVRKKMAEIKKVSVLKKSSQTLNLNLKYVKNMY